jgi:HNH endonuclease
VPSFRDWEFPHGRIPDYWPRISSISSGRGGRCSITNFSFALEEAHLVPREEVLWYHRNNIERYGRELGSIDNVANLLPLKSDMHKCFDKRCRIIDLPHQDCLLLLRTFPFTMRSCGSCMNKLKSGGERSADLSRLQCSWKSSSGRETPCVSRSWILWMHGIPMESEHAQGSRAKGMFSSLYFTWCSACNPRRDWIISSVLSGA